MSQATPRETPAAQPNLGQAVRGADYVALPSAPHDDYSFEQLASAYNFQKTSDWVELFVRLLVKEARSMPKPVVALDIGCGHGIGRSMDRLRAARLAVDELWGLEPDRAVPAPPMFDHYQHALMEDAVLPENRFDLAYSFMVMEHVAQPDRFLSAVHRCLKPGGTYFFITVNGLHYFARATKAVKTLKADEALLRLLRGRQTVEEYHYPVQYRCNRPAVVDDLARRTGFDQPEYVFVEERGPEPYFPGPLRPALKALLWKRKVVRDPRSLLSMIVRMRKAR